MNRGSLKSEKDGTERRKSPANPFGRAGDLLSIHGWYEVRLFAAFPEGVTWGLLRHCVPRNDIKMGIPSQPCHCEEPERATWQSPRVFVKTGSEVEGFQSPRGLLGDYFAAFTPRSCSCRVPPDCRSDPRRTHTSLSQGSPIWREGFSRLRLRFPQAMLQCPRSGCR